MVKHQNTGGTQVRLLVLISNMHRCDWAGDDPLMIAYHDTEWGVPVHDDQTLFEFLLLEGFQAGLSWSTVLHKRAHYKKVMHDFDPQKIAKYKEEKIQKLLQDAGIIRNRLKVRGAVKNAHAFSNIQKEYGSFDAYIWGFVDNTPIINNWKHMSDIPATSELSDIISKDLKKRGCTFVGSTIIYAYMQAIGMVNDHLVDCFRYSEV